MFANKNKEKNSRSRTVATGADSTRLSSKDSRYESGDYEAVPESIRRIRDARNRELEEQNALPAEEIIARQEAEIAELKRQAEAANMTNKYKSVLDDEEEHPTFKNPDSMADFGDYEAVASSAMFEAAKRDPNQKVFRAKPTVATRKVAKPSDLTPGDYEAVAASARRAVPPDEFVPDAPADNEDSDAVASQGADSYMTEQEAARASQSAPSRDVPEYTASAPAQEAADDSIHSEPYTPPVARTSGSADSANSAYSAASVSSANSSYSASADDVIHSEPYTPPQPAPAPVSAADYTVQSYSAPASQQAPQPAPAPVSAADYTVQSYSAPASQQAPQPAPAPVSAADYTVQSYSEPAPQQAPQPAPAPVSAADYMTPSYSAPATSQSYSAPAPAASSGSGNNAIHREPYTPPVASSSYTSQSYVPPAQRNRYSDDGNYDVGGGPMYSPTSGKRIASFEDMAPGDYEAVADSTYDDSDMDLADGSYDFDKYLAGAPSLQMNAAPAVSPIESEWADLGPAPAPDDIEDVDITDEQTRALTEAIAQETLSNQPGTQFEDIIDNVIAKVLERKQQEDAAKAAQQQAAQQQPQQPDQQNPAQQQPQQQPNQQNPAAQQQQPNQQNPAAQQQQPNQQNPAAQQQPAQPDQQQPNQQQPAEHQTQQPAPQPNQQNPAAQQQPKPAGLTPGAIDPSTPIEDIPALILAELDSAEDVSDDEIRKSIDAALIGKLTTGELTLDSVQSVRNKILDEIHEMQEEEARILAQLEGKPVKHPFDPDFLPADIAVEDIPDAVIAELDNVEGEVSDDLVKQSIDKVMIAKLAKGDLTLDSFEEARNSIFDTLGIETAAEQAEEAEAKSEESETAEEQTEEAEAEPEEPVAEPTKEPETEPEEQTEEAEPEEPIVGPELEMTENDEEPAEEPAEAEAEDNDTEAETEGVAEEPVEAEAEAVAEELVEAEDEELIEESAEAEADEVVTDIKAEDTVEEPVESEAEIVAEEPAESETEEPVESEVESIDEESAEFESDEVTAESAEEDEEKEEQTIGIPVPKEPTVLEYDPYADVFVNPSVEEESCDKKANADDEMSEDVEANVDDEAYEESDDAETDETFETPLSAAAVLAMQDRYDELDEDEVFSDESVENIIPTESEEETSEEVSDSDSDEEDEEESVAVDDELVKADEADSAPVGDNPVEKADEESAPVDEEPIEEAEVESAPVGDEPVEEVEADSATVEDEPAEEAEVESAPNEDALTDETETETAKNDVLDMQMTFDDIFRNPFVNDFEPLEHAVEEIQTEEVTEEVTEGSAPKEAEETVSEEAEEAAPEEVAPEANAEPDEVTEETEPDPVDQPVEEVEPKEPPIESTEEVPDNEITETKTDQLLFEDSIDDIEIEDIFTESQSTDEPAKEVLPDEPEAPAKEVLPKEPEAAEEAEPAEEEAETAELEKVSEDVEPEEPADEKAEPEEVAEQDEYAEAKERRHADMQNALLMAMIDDKEKTFSDAVNYMVEQDELNARTLRARMPIDRDTLDRVLKEHDFIPDKKTAIAICFALRLTWEDSVRLLYKAGYTLNDTERYDLTIEYLMRRGVYDQNMINSVLLGSGLEGFGTPQSEI